MRSVFLTHRSHDILDISSEEIDNMNREDQEIGQIEFYSIVETLVYEYPESAYYVTALERYSDACHQNDTSCLVSSLDDDCVAHLLRALTDALALARHARLQGVVAPILKCLCNTACIHNIKQFAISDEKFCMHLRGSLFSTDLHERQLAIVLFENFHVDLNLHEKALVEEYYSIKYVFSQDSLATLMTCGVQHARRCFKDLADMLTTVTFPVHDVAEFFMNAVAVDTPSYFTRHMLRALCKVIKRFDQQLFSTRNCILEWIFRSYERLIAKFGNGPSRMLSAQFVHLISCFVNHIPDETLTRFLLQNDILYDFHRYFPHPMSAEQKRHIAAIALQCQEAYSSIFDSQRVGKDCLYTYIIQCIGDESLQNVMQVLYCKSRDLAANFPLCVQRLLYELDNYLSNNEDFCFSSVCTNKPQFYTANSIIMLLSSMVDTNLSLRGEITRYKKLCQWIYSQKDVDFSTDTEIAFILGESQ